MNTNILDGIKILYVEDDDNIRKIFTKFLERKAQNVEVSTNGEAGYTKFNDTYGHLIGDEILIAISNILEKNTREANVIARWGGEKFVILLPNTKLKDAVVIIEKIRKNIEDFNHETADETLFEARGCGRNLVITKGDIMMKNGED